jgi:hypothetical protein
MRDLIRRAVLAALTASLTLACASDFEVGTTRDPLTAFPPRATLRWDEGAIVRPGDSRLRPAEFDTLIREVVSHEFGARGYRIAESGPAHYLVSYQISVDSRIRAEGSFAIGSLSLQLAEAESGRRVWVGFARAEVNVSRTLAERRERLRQVVAAMLENFPR